MEVMMHKGSYTRDQAVEIVGINAIQELEALTFTPTSRIQDSGDDTTDDGASLDAVTIPDGLACVVSAFCYLTPDQVQTMYDRDGDGSDIDWAIEGYEIA